PHCKRVQIFTVFFYGTRNGLGLPGGWGRLLQHSQTSKLVTVSEIFRQKATFAADDETQSNGRMSRRRRTRVRSWTRPAWWTERHAVSAAGVHRRQNGTYSAPDDHFTAGPDCRVEPSGIRRVGSASRRPTIEIGIVSAAG